jgi:hypothetical protein
MRRECRARQLCRTPRAVDLQFVPLVDERLQLDEDARQALAERRPVVAPGERLIFGGAGFPSQQSRGRNEPDRRPRCEGAARKAEEKDLIAGLVPVREKFVRIAYIVIEAVAEDSAAVPVQAAGSHAALVEA